MIVLKALKWIDDAIGKFSTWGLLLALMLMISLTILNIVLRWFNTTIIWIEPLVRQLVFLGAFLGGTVATGARNHIGIDLAGRLMENFELKGLKIWLDRLIAAFCFGAVCWLIYAGYQLVLVEQEYGQEKFLGIHAATLAAIIPGGLALIAYRFFYILIASFFEPNVAGEKAS